MLDQHVKRYRELYDLLQTTDLAFATPTPAIYYVGNGTHDLISNHPEGPLRDARQCRRRRTGAPGGPDVGGQRARAVLRLIPGCSSVGTQPSGIGGRAGRCLFRSWHRRAVFWGTTGCGTKHCRTAFGRRRAACRWSCFPTC